MCAGRFGSILFATLLLGTAVRARADAPAEKPTEPSPFANIKFEEGPLAGKLEDIATINVPAGAAFVGGRRESAKFIEATQNLVSKQEVGIVVPTGEGEGWWVSFEFDPMGFVKDEEKGKLDADAILKSLRESTEEANGERKRRGWEELHVVGWHTPPRYNPTTHNLEWATRLGSSGGENVNYNVRLLGRRGVMSVTLVAGPNQFDATLAKMQSLLAGFGYEPEQAYAAFKPGDKIAEYGLTALVVGGVVAAAAKSGLLAKLWKVIVGAAVVVAGALRRLFGGKKKQDEPTV